MARGAAAPQYRPLIEAKRRAPPTARPWSRRRTRADAQRRARAQPRRRPPGLLLGAGPLLGRAVPGRRAHGQRSTASSSKTAADPHLESLQFINSAGGWDRAGRRFAFGAVGKGRPALVVLRRRAAATCARSRSRSSGEIFDPELLARRPAGRVLGPGGRLHRPLRLRPRQAGACGALTNDAYADLQPAWSPGRTQHRVRRPTASRPTSTPSTPATTGWPRGRRGSGEIRPLPSFEEGKNINPQWSADGESVFFISDRTGITQHLPARRRQRRRRSQVTDLLTGVSGITAPQPRSPCRGAATAWSTAPTTKAVTRSTRSRAPEKLAGWEAPGERARVRGLIPAAKYERRRASTPRRTA